MQSVAFSPDGRWLASGSADTTIKIWEVATGREVRTLRGHTSLVLSVAFSPDGHWLASGGWDKTVKLWEVETGREVRTLTGHSEHVQSIAFSPDGCWLASGSDDQTIKLWEVETGREVRTLSGHTALVRSVTFSPDGRWLASGSADNTIKLWEVATGREARTLSGHADAGNSVAFSRDGNTLASGGYDGNVRLWEVDTAREVRTLTGEWVLSVAFSRDGRWLAAGCDDGAVRLWEVATGREARRLTGHAEKVQSVAFSPDGRWLASGSDDGTVKLWEVETGREVRTLSARTGLVRSVAVSPDGRWLASAGHDRTIKLWDVATGRGSGTFSGHTESVDSIAFGPDGRWLVSGSQDDTVKLWNVGTSREVRTLAGHIDAPVASVAASSDGRWLASGSWDKTIKLWEIETGREMRTLSGHTNFVASVAFSPDGRWLASGSWDKTIKLWEIETGREVRTLSGHTKLVASVAFSPDGRWLASGSYDGTVRLWEVTTGRQVQALSVPAAAVLSVAFSPDGHWLASGNGNKTVTLWDSSTGRELHTFIGHSGAASSVAFGPGGSWLASGSYDGSTRIWDPQTGELLATLTFAISGKEWLVATPDGLFDGSPEGMRKLVAWRFAGNETAPAEIFFNEFYHPGLLADILAGKRPRAQTDIAGIDRRQPEVKLSVATRQPDAAVAGRKVKVRVEVQEAPADSEHPAGSGAQDLRLFRNGSLVRIWHGDVLHGEKRATLDTEVTLVAGSNRLTAYAFNHKNIKSADATLNLTGAASLERRGTAYILALGINRYASADFNLRYAAADAQDFAAEVEQQQKKLAKYAKVEITSLEDQQATKANLLAALKHLAEVAQPEDAVFIYYAGHGTAAGPHFYLIPHDLGYTGTRTELDQAGVQSVLDHSVSDLELNQVFEGIDAGEIVLVIDACRSGQALQADDPRQGPMNSKGLAQLAYDKGMYILTASQGYQAALEASSYGHGLLTYALVEEGLKSAKADDGPKDGQVMLREWLDYVSQEVPQLELALMQEARRRGAEIAIVEGEQKIADVEKRSLQQPRVFYRREPEAVPLVVAKP